MMIYLRKAVRDIQDNRFLTAVTVITIALSILISSTFVLFIINTNALMDSWKQGIRLMAYLRPAVLPADLPGVASTIRGTYGVEEAVFIPKGQALARLRAQMKHQASLFADLKENPLPDAFEVRMIPTTQTIEKIQRLAERLEAVDGVDEVEYGQRWLGRFTDIFDLIQFAGYSLGCLFFMAAVFFVANTIRLVLYSRREEVEIMRLVGAEDRFIKTPFYIQGLIQGLAGGLIGIGALSIIYLVVASNMDKGLLPAMFEIRFLPPQTLAVVLGGAMFAGWTGCYLSLKQYLNT
jgi:cell division transport system permease protein